MFCWLWWFWLFHSAAFWLESGVWLVCFWVSLFCRRKSSGYGSQPITTNHQSSLKLGACSQPQIIDLLIFEVAAVLTTLGNLLTSKWVSRIQCCVLQCIWKVVMEPVFRTSHFYHGFEPHFRKSHWLCDLNTQLSQKNSVFLSSTLARCLLRKRANCFQQVRPCVPSEHESQNVCCQPWIVTVASLVTWVP